MGGALSVKVWGDMACFTRPEAKVERVSYSIMTPSAARGVLEAIFWQPEFRWEVRAIQALKPPRFISLVRNEVCSRASLGHLLFADEERAQRHTLALQDVAYILKAEIVLTPKGRGQDPAKYKDQFRRRVEKGQCHYQPYLGCREFTAFFGPVQEGEKPVDDWTEDLGPMLFDLDYSPEEGRHTPVFFPARVERGILHVPPELYKKLRWCHVPQSIG